MAVYPHSVVPLIPPGRQVGDGPDEVRSLADLGAAPPWPIRLPRAPRVFYGVRRLAAYTGPCIRVRRSSDNAETDIGFANNRLNAFAIEAFRGTSSLFLVTWYDQSGNNLHATEGTPANQCPVDVGAFWGETLSIAFDGRSSGTVKRRSLTLPAALSLDGRNASFALVAAPMTSRQNNCFLEIGTVAANVLNLFQYDVPNALSSNGNTLVVSTPAGTFLRAQPTFMGLTSSAAGRRLYADLASVDLGIAGAGPVSGGTIGATVAGAGFNGKFDLFACAIFDAALTDAQMTDVRTELLRAFPLALRGGVPLVFEGDSITEGYGSLFNRSGSRLTAEALPKPVRLFNQAISASALIDRIPAYNVGIAPLFEPGGILLLALGRNDLTVGRSAAQISADLRSYCTLAKATGYRTVIRTILPRSADAFDAIRTTVNTDIRSGLSGLANAVSDAAADPVLAAPASLGDANVYLDGLHLGPLGCSRVGAVDADAIATLL